MEERAFGYSFCNPDRVDRDYLAFCVQYCIKAHINHIQIIGPIHDTRIGNVDGMTLYKKYSQFNEGKDLDYIAQTRAAFAEVLPEARAHGIKSYVWHHELELSDDFAAAFPETLNETGDYEVSHPLIKDYLENKISDFFEQYPDVDGIVLTLHETKVPLLKLKNQKLSRGERVRYITDILYQACKRLGKELIVRPFASIPEDYSMLMDAYAKISPDLVVMDKWTQFDWSLCAPHNSFFNRIEHNPLLVEADIFGEFFGKGRLPLMLLDHIKAKVAYCEQYSPRGYCARIDRNGMIPFGDVNEVNLAIMNAAMNGADADEAALRFYRARYGEAGEAVFEIMKRTEACVSKIIYLRGYYFSELSYFPGLNHSKNHFYFEMMREGFELCSGEWFIPIGWNRGTMEEVFAEKDEAVREATELYAQVMALNGKLNEGDFAALSAKFDNLRLVAQMWRGLVDVFYHYEQFFVKGLDPEEEAKLGDAIAAIERLHDEGGARLGNRFYAFLHNKGELDDYPKLFLDDLRESFAAEKADTAALLADGSYFDFCLCGGGAEGHRLKKEVNYSDTLVIDSHTARIPGHNPARDWGRINTHGWFSYELTVPEEGSYTLEVVAGSFTDRLSCTLTVDDETVRNVCQPVSAKKAATLLFPMNGQKGKNSIRVRVDRNSADTPFICRIAIKK